MKKTIVIIFLCLVSLYSFSQGTAINASGAAADNSAMLDVASSGKGILIPRIALSDTADASTILLPATSVLVYNTSSGGGLVPGYYYNAGTPSAPKWAQLMPDPANSSLNMANYKITNLATCTNNLDAANKAYVDAQVAMVGGSGFPVPVMISDESATSMYLRQACDYCRTLTENGYTDWRLPTFHEFLTVLSTTNYPIPSSSSGNWVWLMDYDTQYGTYYYQIRITDGYLSRNTADNNYKVRCVR